MPFSENIRDIQPSATLAVAALARDLLSQGRDIVDLSAGEPDFPTPAFVAEAGAAAIREGATRYTPAPGLPALRKAIAHDLARRGGRAVDPAGIVVTAGAKQALFNVLFTLFGPGARVLCPVPYWTSYPALVGLARADFVPVRGDPDRSFKVTPDDLEAAAGPGARGLILNSPANPTGAVYSLDELEALARWAVERDVRIVSDEIYGRLCYTAPRAPGVLDLPPELGERAVLVDGASKTFAMTGWRIGFSASDVELAQRMAALQSHTTSNAATPSQYAALAAFADTELQDEAVTSMVAAFRRRRDLVVSLFRERLPDAAFVEPEGAFYLFFRADPFYHDDAPNSVEFCRTLIEDAGVALVPGAAFGDDRYVRLSFAASDDALEEGIRRLAAALRRRKAGAGATT